MQKKGNKYGTHRVIEPKGVLPQPANKLDNNMDEIYDNEILIDVQTLNIDSASFTDIHNYAKQQAGEGASQEKGDAPQRRAPGQAPQPSHRFGRHAPRQG